MTDIERDELVAGEAQSAPRPTLIERLRGLFGLSGPSIRDDIQIALEDTSASDDFSPQERAMLKNVLGLHELRVEDVMVPRADIIAVGLETSLRDVLAVFRTAGHSRLPVHADTLDDPRGMVHIRDFVDYIAARAETTGTIQRELGDDTAPVTSRAPEAAYASALDLGLSLAQANILRPVLFVPPSMPALDLLVKMQATRTHMALIIDEYGGTDGLASIEDIVEMIVGDIEDEHDLDDDPQIVAAPDGTFTIDARANLEDVSGVIGADFTGAGVAEEIDTIGGLIASIAGRVPMRGEIVADSARGIEFEILDADPRRVKRIKLHRRDQGSAGPSPTIHDNGAQTQP
ncbi:MAG: hemolysin family protein [Beijerinckiaceae bacterium]